VEEEHGQVSRELERLPRQADLEARVATLNHQLDELRDEIRKRSKDILHYTAEVGTREQRLGSILQDTEDLRSTEGALQDELIQIRSAPGNLPREIDCIHKRYRDTRQQVTETVSHSSRLMEQLGEVQARRQAMHSELGEAEKTLVEAREEGNRLHDLRRQADSSLAQTKERQVALLEQEASLELALRHRGSEYGRLYESSTSLAKTNDRVAKQVKKAELLAQSVREAEAQLQQRAEALQEEVGRGEAAVKEWQQRQLDVREEARNLQRELSLQDGVGAAQRTVLEERQQEEERVRAKVASLTNKLQDLAKDTVALTRQRDRDSRACHLAKLSEHGTKSTLSTKEAQLQEQRKTLAHVQRKLADFAEAYKLIKTERNHTHTQIQKLQQLASEMKERWRVLENEAEVLTTTAQEKDT
jgi:chromosome segregation ATPase